MEKEYIPDGFCPRGGQGCELTKDENIVFCRSCGKNFKYDSSKSYGMLVAFIYGVIIVFTFAIIIDFTFAMIIDFDLSYLDGSKLPEIEYKE